MVYDFLSEKIKMTKQIHRYYCEVFVVYGGGYYSISINVSCKLSEC